MESRSCELTRTRLLVPFAARVGGFFASTIPYERSRGEGRPIVLLSPPRSSYAIVDAGNRSSRVS